LICRAGPSANPPILFSLTSAVSPEKYSYGMSKLLRHFAQGQYVFVTVVTANRRPLLLDNIKLLGRAVCRAKRTSQFDIIAWVVLPDHFHAIIHTPREDASKILHRVKLSFAMQVLQMHGQHHKVWQHRFWDHVIRSHKDFTRHLDYIHFNPVRHRLTNSPNDWRLSSLSKFQQAGIYEGNWRDHEIECDIDEAGE
jgi:putative transposase